VGVSKGSINKIPDTWVEAVTWIHQQIKEVASDRLLLLCEAFAVEASGYKLLYDLGEKKDEFKETQATKLGATLQRCAGEVLGEIQSEIKRRKLKVLRENISPLGLKMLYVVKKTYVDFKKGEKEEVVSKILRNFR